MGLCRIIQSSCDYRLRSAPESRLQNYALTFTELSRSQLYSLPSGQRIELGNRRLTVQLPPDGAVVLVEEAAELELLARAPLVVGCPMRRQLRHFRERPATRSGLALARSTPPSDEPAHGPAGCRPKHIGRPGSATRDGRTHEKPRLIASQNQ
jgi:hypothetical protein